jgi:hypothetical protein
VPAAEASLLSKNLTARLKARPFKSHKLSLNKLKIFMNSNRLRDR